MRRPECSVRLGALCCPGCMDVHGNVTVLSRLVRLDRGQAAAAQTPTLLRKA